MKKDRNCLVLAQHREGSEYNDFIGSFYHFPKKYLKAMQNEDAEFVYFEPSKKGSGAYFGYGKLSGEVFEDKREPGKFFAKIVDYRLFEKEVPFKNKQGAIRETGPSYNAQNAVRRTEPDVLDGICLDGGILLNFTADAHLIKVLGEQLIASEQVGVLELIKNAYDANAKKCKVRIEQIPNLSNPDDDVEFASYVGPVVVIEDDGCGMDKESIENGWLRPASTLKTNVKDRLKREREKARRSGNLGVYNALVAELKSAHGGRIPLGEKGVGRFATHRLGRYVEIITKTPENDYEYALTIDWDKFDTQNGGVPKRLDSIGIALYRRPPSRDYGASKSGTRIIISGGREGFELNERVINGINSSILKLISPAKETNSFTVELECPQVELEDETSWVDQFPPLISVDVLVDENGMGDFDVQISPPNETLLHPEKRTYRKDLRKRNNARPKHWLSIDSNDGKREAKCGAFYFHLDIWIRSKPWIDGPNVKSFTATLDRFGGVSLYRDGLNILSAERGTEMDWLQLSKRHIKKGSNISYYNFMGALELDQSKNIDLIDQTDRQGLIENDAFLDLRELTRNIILEFELEIKSLRDRAEKIAPHYKQAKDLVGKARQGGTIIERITNQYDVLKDPNKLLKGFGNPDERIDRLIDISRSLKDAKKTIGALENMKDLLTEQAGYGLAIGVAVHEVAKITSNFYHSIVKMLDKGVDEHTLEKLRDTSSSLKQEMKRLGPMRAIRSEPLIEFKIEKSIKYCNAVFNSRFEKEGIQITWEGDSFPVYARYGAVNQVLSNLVDNSVYWLDGTPKEERRIVIHMNAERRRMVVADNGPGIDEIMRPNLFEPGYSLKVPPSGLGLYICKYYMKGMKGNIYEASSRDQISGVKGAHFVLDFSRVPEDKE